MECLCDLETRMQEGETARRAVGSRQKDVSNSLHRLAQDQVDFNPQDAIEPLAPEDESKKT